MGRGKSEKNATKRLRQVSLAPLSPLQITNKPITKRSFNVSRSIPSNIKTPTRVTDTKTSLSTLFLKSSSYEPNIHYHFYRPSFFWIRRGRRPWRAWPRSFFSPDRNYPIKQTKYVDKLGSFIEFVLQKWPGYHPHFRELLKNKEVARSARG